MSALDAIDLIDGLYRSAIEDPGAIDDAMLGEWIDGAAETIDHDRGHMASLRRAVRNARKLAVWFDKRSTDLPDWRNGVDEVLGGRGWEPHLDLARTALEAHPSEDLFEAVRTWHRAVHFTEWMEGVSYAEWLG